MAQQILTNSLKQQTLAKPVHCVGIGLHSGKKVSMVIQPAETNSGINFYRKDAHPGKGFITGRWYNVTDTKMSTTIANEYGVKIQTVEHILAALRGCGIDNALIDPDSQACTFTSYLEETSKVSSTAAATRASQGVYYYDYTLPTTITNYIVEMKGTFSGDVQLKRHKLKARFKN